MLHYTVFYQHTMQKIVLQSYATLLALIKHFKKINIRALYQKCADQVAHDLESWFNLFNQTSKIAYYIVLTNISENCLKFFYFF